MPGWMKGLDQLWGNWGRRNLLAHKTFCYAARVRISGKMILMTGLGSVCVFVHSNRGWTRSSTCCATSQSNTALPQWGQVAIAGMPVIVTVSPSRRKTWVAIPLLLVFSEQTEQFISFSSSVLVVVYPQSISLYREHKPMLCLNGYPWILPDVIYPSKQPVNIRSENVRMCVCVNVSSKVGWHRRFDRLLHLALQCPWPLRLCLLWPAFWKITNQ